MNTKDKYFRYVVYLGLLVGLVFSTFPVIWIVSSSFKSNTEIFSLPPKIIPDSITFIAYISIFEDNEKIRFFINSYFVSIVVTALTLIIAILSGYSFSRYNFKFKRFLNLTIISTQTIPPISLLIPYFGIVIFFKIFDTYMALVLTYLVFTLPYATLMMTSYFNSLPKELDEQEGRTALRSVGRHVD